MIGAIIGDILGSTFEGSCAPSSDHPFFPEGSRFTDDTICTIAICESTLNRCDHADSLRKWANLYPNAGYGGTFRQWMVLPDAGPYQSYANGALMRVSPAVALSHDLAHALENARAATEVTHNHEMALLAVECYVDALWAALAGASHLQICSIIETRGYNPHDVEERHHNPRFNLRADETLSDVLSCLQVASDFDSLMRECLYHGGDTDTICAIAGPLGEALWGIPLQVAEAALSYLPGAMIELVNEEYKRMSTMHYRF
jgi:ADP-ribosyl-[dinitrogen reductase] hydrolase